MRKPRPLSAGVTKLELCMGLAALALLSTAAVAVFSGGSAESEKAEAVSVAKRLAGAVSGWKKEHGVVGCPSVSQLLQDKRWSSRESSEDPWGGRFRISCSEDKVSVKSAGGDGRFETEDDIAVKSDLNS